MFRNLLIVATLFAIVVHSTAVGCCGHHAHESACLCCETAHGSNGSGEVGGGTCSHKQSGCLCEEGDCVWLSESQPTIEFGPPLTVFPAFTVSSEESASRGLRQHGQLPLEVGRVGFGRLQGELAVWLI